MENLKEYDDYRYVDDNKLNIDRKTWDKICYYRRLKIELDLRIGTCQKDVAEKTNLINKLVRDKKRKETLVEEIKTRIAQIENQNSHYGDDPEVENKNILSVKIAKHYVFVFLGAISIKTRKRRSSAHGTYKRFRKYDAFTEK